MGRPGKKGQAPSSEEEQDEEISAIDVDEDDEDDLDSADVHEALPGQSEKQLQEKIAEELLEQAKHAQEGLVPTWNALHSLKKQEIQLNSQMQEAIEKVKEKYELLKQPIFHQVSQAALGEKVDDKLYQP